MMNIIIISGSVRTGRKSHQVSITLQNHLIAAGVADTQVLDLAAYNLPVLEEKYIDGAASTPDGLAEIQTILNGADGFIFLSPEYHGSYTGAFKNAVDYFWKEFQKKPIGVVATGSGKMGGINASTELQQLVLSLGAYAMPYKLLVSGVQHAFDEAGTILDENLKKGIDKFTTEYKWFAEAIVDRKRKVV